MATISVTYSVNFGTSNTGRSDIAFALEGNAFATTGVTESSTVPGVYAITVSQSDTLTSRACWRIPLTGGGYRYAVEDIRPAEAVITDKTGFKLSSDGLDQVLVEQASSGGSTVNIRQAIAGIASREIGNWTRDPTTGNATFYAAANPSVTRLVYSETTNAVTVTLTLPT